VNKAVTLYDAVKRMAKISLTPNSAMKKQNYLFVFEYAIYALFLKSFSYLK